MEKRREKRDYPTNTLADRIEDEALRLFPIEKREDMKNIISKTWEKIREPDEETKNLLNDDTFWNNLMRFTGQGRPLVSAISCSIAH